MTGTVQTDVLRGIPAIGDGLRSGMATGVGSLPHRFASPRPPVQCGRACQTRRRRSEQHREPRLFRRNPEQTEMRAPWSNPKKLRRQT